jgi:hypothetical protein
MPATPDQLFEQFVQAYPAARRQRGYMVSHLFLAALEKAGSLVLMTALEQHKKSEQWENLSMIPSMKKWLEEERWIQILPERRSGEDRRSVPRVGERRAVPKHEPL